MLRTNREKVVMMSVQGKVSMPSGRKRHLTDRDGRPFLLPGTGGIAYNVKVGDPAMGWAADHVEPCVSTLTDEKDRYGDPNTGYNFYACVGNEARVLTGGAKGETGVVTGQHGGVEHVLIDFPDRALAKLSLDDKVLIRGFGQGLRLLDFPDVHVYNLDPDLLGKMRLKAKGKVLETPVAAVVPAPLMGSGIGSTEMGSGDYDIMTTDAGMLKKHGLMSLRLGDLVAIQDHDNVYGRSFRKGAVAVGIVVHSDCYSAGHGPGVTTLLASSKPAIEPKLDKRANIADILRIGRCRGKGR
ncbi:MAG: DUF4438 domain-containing protein [Elusimicrobia bacterium]|nr:DUF4438 domain-containing protein [Elusimicrobiota bacterium]